MNSPLFNRSAEWLSTREQARRRWLFILLLISLAGVSTARGEAALLV